MGRLLQGSGSRLIAALGAALLPLAAVACFSPDLPPVACGAGGACPRGLVCATDNMCRESGSGDILPIDAGDPGGAADAGDDRLDAGVDAGGQGCGAPQQLITGNAGFAVPAGCTAASVRMWGGGGGGGEDDGAGGSEGGAGGFVSFEIEVAEFDVVQVLVGRGGQGGGCGISGGSGQFPGGSGGFSGGNGSPGSGTELGGRGVAGNDDGGAGGDGRFGGGGGGGGSAGGDGGGGGGATGFSIGTDTFVAGGGGGAGGGDDAGIGGDGGAACGGDGKAPTGDTSTSSDTGGGGGGGACVGEVTATGIGRIPANADEAPGVGLGGDGDQPCIGGGRAGADGAVIIDWF